MARSCSLGETLKALICALASLICYPTAVAAADTDRFILLKLGGNTVHWQSESAGHAPLITYRILKSPREFDRARNCQRLGALDDLAASSQLPEDVIRREAAAAFDMWQHAANITFREARNSETANILIGAQLEPEGWAFTNVAYDAHSPEDIKPITQSLICLNPLKRWKVGFDGNLKIYDIRYTLAHEIGHAIGLDHSSGDDQVIGYLYHEQFRDLQQGDIAGAIHLYGPREPEPMIAEIDQTRFTRQSSSGRPTSKHWGTRAFIGRTHTHPNTPGAKRAPSPRSTHMFRRRPF